MAIKTIALLSNNFVTKICLQIKMPFILILAACIYTTDIVNAKAAPLKKLVIAADYWCPYNCIPGSDYQGFLVDVIKEALQIYDIKIEYKIIPWYEALKQIKTGQIDGIIGISDVMGLNVVTTKTPLEYSVTSSFSRSSTNWVYDGLSSLTGKKIGIIMDYAIDEDINNFVGMNYTTNPGMFVIEDGKNAVVDCITHLVNGTIDVYIEDTRVVEYYIKKNNLSKDIKNTGKINNNKLPLYVAFSDQIPDIRNYVKLLEEGIASLKATGEYDYLRTKYKMDN